MGSLFIRCFYYVDSRDYGFIFKTLFLMVLRFFINPDGSINGRGCTYLMIVKPPLVIEFSLILALNTFTFYTIILGPVQVLHHRKKNI